MCFKHDPYSPTPPLPPPSEAVYLPAELEERRDPTRGTRMNAHVQTQWQKTCEHLQALQP